jgi:hypothetical protein
MHECHENGLLQIIQKRNDFEELHFHDPVLRGEVHSQEEINL